MSESSQDEEVFEAWEEWIDHWRYSNQTSFRVAAELKRATDAWLWSIRDLEIESLEGRRPLKIEPSEGESVIFVRHPLLSGNGEIDTPEIEGSLKRRASLEFTQSTYLAQLFATTDAVRELRVKVSSQSGKESYLVQAIDDRVIELADWLEHTVDGQGKELWKKVLIYLQKSERELHEHEINFRLLENPAEWKSLGIAQRPNLFGNLFLAFSLLSHKGFLADNLNEWHLSEANDGVAKRTQSTLGYLLHTKPHSIDVYPEIEEALILSHDGKTLTLLTDKDFDDKISRQNHLSIFAGIEVNSHHDIAFKLTWKLFGIFNELPKSGKFDNIYHFVVPVYAWSAPPDSSGHVSSNSYHHVGALLGWAFYRFLLPEDAPPPHFWPDGSGSTKSGLTQALDRLAVSMESFAKNYLSGETEWALERPWHTNDSAILFMKRNFFHSCGWDCKDIIPSEQDSYFKPEEDRRSCLVNLTRQTPRGSGGGKRQALVATLAPNSLCILPEEESVRNSFFGSLAEHARYFYERCLYIQEIEQAGRVSVSHSLQFTVSVQLQKLTDVAQEVRQLQTSPELFPIQSFADLPDAIRRFQYPVDLYSVAIENAIEQYSGSEGFSRLFPVVDWIDDAIEKHGYDELYVRDLAQKIAIPLARISLRRASARREPNATLSVSGVLSCDQLTPGKLQEGRILTATLIELLREAFHHSQGFDPKVEVALISEPAISITIANSCGSNVDVEKLAGGNQSKILECFSKHLHTWEIAPPSIDEDKRWIRTLKRRPS